MKQDIISREDIHFIISDFYSKLINDKSTRPFFESFIKNNTLEKHIDIITDFWEDILFSTIKYSNNVLQKHLDINTEIKFEKEHFELWLNYFIETINNNFSGLNAELMKNRAKSIATVMQVKMKLYK